MAQFTPPTQQHERDFVGPYLDGLHCFNDHLPKILLSDALFEYANTYAQGKLNEPIPKTESYNGNTIDVIVAVLKRTSTRDFDEEEARKIMHHALDPNDPYHRTTFKEHYSNFDEYYNYLSKEFIRGYQERHELYISTQNKLSGNTSDFGGIKRPIVKQLDYDSIIGSIYDFAGNKYGRPWFLICVSSYEYIADNPYHLDISAQERIQFASDWCEATEEEIMAQILDFEETRHGWISKESFIDRTKACEVAEIHEKFLGVSCKVIDLSGENCGEYGIFAVLSDQPINKEDLIDFSF